MILQLYTLFHVVISLLALFSGFVVLWGLINSKSLNGWTAFFLATTVTTSVTGFFFPVHHFMPSHALGIISLIVLAFAIYARYPKKLNGGWRKIYVITAVTALYLNFFVGVVQAFEKVPALKALAPTQSEPPFKLTQLGVLVLFVVLGIAATVRFHKEPAHAI